MQKHPPFWYGDVNLYLEFVNIKSPMAWKHVSCVRFDLVKGSRTVPYMTFGTTEWCHFRSLAPIGLIVFSVGTRRLFHYLLVTDYPLFILRLVLERPCLEYWHASIIRQTYSSELNRQPEAAYPLIVGHAILKHRLNTEREAKAVDRFISLWHGLTIALRLWYG